MPLNQAELDAIAQHGTGHPLLGDLIQAQDWISIAGYYATLPTTYQNPDASRKLLMTLMPFSVESKFYAIKDFRLWYSQLAGKIDTNIHVHPINLNPLSSITDTEIRAEVKNMIFVLNEHHETLIDFPLIVQRMFARTAGGDQETISAIYSMFVALLTDDVFTLELGLIYAPEIKLQERYITLGLSAPPTVTEIETAFSS